MVEDSPEDAELTLLEIEAHDYRVNSTRVTSGEAFVQHLRESHWDLVLCDYNLPGFSGIEALKLYKEQGSDIPFILLSGIIGEETAVNAMKSGAHDYILKDNITRLVPAIEREIKEYGHRQELARAEHELIRQNTELQELNKALSKMNQDLRKAKERAEESDKLKSAFLANISHEIRTPMNGILGFAKLLLNPDLSGEQQKDYLDIIQKSGRRMLNIINDLVDISKIESGHTEIHVKEVDVCKVLSDLHAFFLPEYIKKDISLEYMVPEDCENIIIHADGNRLIQILSNLIKNALKFTREGRVVFGFTAKEDAIEFFVKDTGIGIPPALAGKVFERFRKIDFDAEEAYEGAGLGLSISKAFVEAHGGKIWLESAENEGSSFYFTIPCNFPGYNNS